MQVLPSQSENTLPSMVLSGDDDGTLYLLQAPHFEKQVIEATANT